MQRIKPQVRPESEFSDSDRAEKLPSIHPHKRAAAKRRQEKKKDGELLPAVRTDPELTS